MIQKGYTLIEVLVVILIISLMASFSFARLRDFQRRQLIASATRQIAGDLRDLQSSSSVGQKPSGCTGELQGYEFEVSSSSPAIYNLNAICEFSTELVKQVSLEDISINPRQNVLFLPLSRGASFTGGSPKRYTISHLSTGDSTVLAISTTGEIYEE